MLTTPATGAAPVKAGAALRLRVKLAEIGVVTVGRPAPHVPSASTSTEVFAVLITYELFVAVACGASVKVANN